MNEPTIPLDGEVLTWNEQGQLACRAHFAAGLLHGLTERYDDARRLVQAIPYRHGLIHGTMTLYEEGARVAEIDYAGGLRDGAMVSYGADGAPTSRVAHMAGKPHGAALYYYPGGTLARSAHHAHGLLEGETRDYAEDGALLAHAFYRQGKKHGLCTKYHPNGKVMEEAQFADGQAVGRARKYDKDGAAEDAGKKPPKRERALSWVNKLIEG